MGTRFDVMQTKSNLFDSFVRSSKELRDQLATIGGGEGLSMPFAAAVALPHRDARCDEEGQQLVSNKGGKAR
jgi:hypothetical protein